MRSTDIGHARTTHILGECSYRSANYTQEKVEQIQRWLS